MRLFQLDFPRRAATTLRYEAPPSDTDAGKTHRRRRHILALLATALALEGCMYGYETRRSITPLGSTYPRTTSVDLYFRPPAKDEHCVAIAFVKVAGSRFESTSEILRKLREDAMSVGADAIFSVAQGETLRAQGDYILELDPKNKPTVYDSNVVTGLAARCTPPEVKDDDRFALDTSPPVKPLGYSFGETRTEVGTRCAAQGHGYSISDSDAACDGTPDSFELAGRVGFKFCSGGLCRVDVVGRIGARMDVPWLSEFDRLSRALIRRYGSPQSRDRKIPAGCAGDALLSCLSSNQASYTARWLWNDGTALWLELGGVDDSPALRVVYDVSERRKPRRAPAE